MLLALAQINPKVGDIDANAGLIAHWTAKARDAGADVVVFPELALVGYPPRDLLHQEGFVAAAHAAAKRLGEACSEGITLIFGTPLPADGADVAPTSTSGDRGVANALVAYRDGRMLEWYDKRLLPTYDVFDEDRYFTAGVRAVVLGVPTKNGIVPIGLTICEDLWRGEDVGFAGRYFDMPDPVAELMGAPVTPRLIINPSASPFVLGKGPRHREILRKHARRHGVFVAAVNQVGGNDELIFDGHAAVIDPHGKLIAAGPGFEEALTLCEISDAGSLPEIADPIDEAPEEELLFQALRLGVRDYLRKTGFKSAVLGLSGGIDSAVACVLAAAALGPTAVLGVGMPSRFSSEGSVTDARDLAARLGVAFQLLPIEDAFSTLLGTLGPLFNGRPPDLAEENLQARIRGTILMGVSNKLGHLLLTTGNKSELAVGYCTLYGDMNGGLAVLSDTTKEWVYRLSRWMNAHWEKLGIASLNGPPIPEATITKPPSAELRANQTDQDSLPAYPVLDEIVDRYVGRHQSVGTIVRETGFDDAVVRRMARLIDLSEFKRKQAAIGLKVTGVAFGSGRRMPIAQGWRSP